MSPYSCRPYPSGRWALSCHVFTVRQLTPSGRALLVRGSAGHRPPLHSGRVCPKDTQLSRVVFSLRDTSPENVLAVSQLPGLEEGRLASLSPSCPRTLGGGWPWFRGAVWTGTYKAVSPSLLGTCHCSCHALSSSAADTTFLCPTGLLCSPTSFSPEDTLTLALVKLGAASTGAGVGASPGKGTVAASGSRDRVPPTPRRASGAARGFTQHGLGCIHGGWGRGLLPVGHTSPVQ